MELTDGIYAYLWSRPGNGCNTYAVRYNVAGRSRYLLIDPGQRRVVVPTFDSMYRGVTSAVEEPALEVLWSEMAKDGIAPEDIGLVACTHCHPDHCEAALEIRERTGALLAVHKDERDAMVRILSESYAGMNGDRRPVMEPDVFLDNGELQLGTGNPVSIKVIHTPGHSTGSISFYIPKDRVLISGDVVFYRNVGRTDFPGGDARVLRESVVKLSELDVEHVLTGHPYGHPGLISGKAEVESNFRFILLQILAF